MKHRGFSVGVIVCLCTFIPRLGLAQSSISLAGSVLDPRGATVPGAAVTLRATGMEAERRIESDSSGTFDVADLAPGEYTILVEKEGFEPEAAGPFLLRSGERRSGIAVRLVLAGVSESVVVTADRAALPADDIPRPVSVISREDLASRPGVTGLQPLLAEVPGISFARSGALGGQIVFRGFNSNGSRSVLAVDGDRFRGRTTLEFGLFDPNAVDHLEVVRGSASAAYGADAMNGVVNIFTQRSYRDPQSSFSLVPQLLAFDAASNGGFAGVRPALIGGGRGTDIFIGSSLRRSGDYESPLGTIENSGFVHRGLDARIGVTFGSSRIEGSTRVQNVETGRAGGVGGAPGVPLREVNENPMRERFVRASLQTSAATRTVGDLSGSLYVRSLQTEIYQIDRTSAAATVAMHTAVHTPTIVGGRVFAAKVLARHHVTYGVEFFDELGSGRLQETVRTNPATGAVISQTPPTLAERDSRQTNIGVLINDHWTPHDYLTVSAGLRRDWIRSTLGDTPAPSETQVIRDAYARSLEGTNTPTTGSVGAVVRVAPILHFVGSWSRSYRDATTGERVGRAGTIATLPAPELKPEHSHTGEFGVRLRARGQSASLTAYRSHYSDLIQSVAVTPNQQQPQNVGKARVSGIELDGRSDVARMWAVRYALAMTRGTNLTTGVPLASIAPLSGRVAVGFEPSTTWSAEVSSTAFKGTSRIDPAQERRRPGYLIVDLHTSFALDKVTGRTWGRWRLVPGVTNLFDKAARNPATVELISFSNALLGNPLYEPGRSFVVKLTSTY